MIEVRLRELFDGLLKDYCLHKKAELPSDFVYDIQTSHEASHGDYAVNIAFKLARVLSGKPFVLAQEIKKNIEDSENRIRKDLIERVDVAGGGFINVFIKKESLAEILRAALHQDKDYGKSGHGQGRKVIVEFVSANPTGPLTIAHGRQAAVGDSLSRILQMTGHKVHREFYLNDAGRQMNLLGASLWARYCEEFKMEAALPEDGYRGAYMIDLAKDLVKLKRDSLLKEDPKAAAALCTEYAKNRMMETIESDLEKFRVRFDQYFSEKSLYADERVNKTLESLEKINFLYEQDGALWFRSTAFGDDKDRVVKKSTGEFTYLAPDIAYHKTKYERGFQEIINLWGPDHHGYIPRLKAACQALGFKSEDIHILIVQLSTLFRNGQPVRMSTRAGEFVTLQELIDEVGVDAARFFFIMRRVESPLDFDLDLAKQKSQDNPVYYLQYAHARIASILNFSQRSIKLQADLGLLNSNEEAELIRMIGDFPKVLVQASEMLEPYRLADYLRDLAAAFHKFYSVHRVVGSEENVMDARLVLVAAVKIVLRNGLELLGISQPDSM